MRSDNSIHLTTAAQQRHELTRAKAIAALHELDRAGAKITFESVADHAGVSRSWIYTQTDLKDEIRRLRAQHPAPTATPIPARQRASDDSLRQRLEIAQPPQPRTRRREPATTPPTRPRPRPTPRQRTNHRRTTISRTSQFGNNRPRADRQANDSHAAASSTPPRTQTPGHSDSQPSDSR